MASSLDYQRIFERYQTEGVPNGITIVDFCQRNGVVYKQFERWYKNKDNVELHPVRLTGDQTQSQKEFEKSNISESLIDQSENKVLFSIKISTNRGMLLQQRNLDYRKLLVLVEKLEVLC